MPGSKYSEKGAKMSSQTDRLMQLLSDFQWHSTPEILLTVYGSDHLGIARIAARVSDAKKLLEPLQTIESKPDPEKPSIWMYRKINVAPPVEKPPAYELFR